MADLETIAAETIDRLRSALASKTEEAERLRAFLLEYEWSGWRSDNTRYDVVGAACCPECYGMKRDGHREGCRLAAALSSPESAPAPRRVPLVDNGRGQLVYAPTDEQAASADAFIRERLARAPAPESAETAANSSSKEG